MSITLQENTEITKVLEKRINEGKTEYLVEIN